MEDREIRDALKAKLGCYCEWILKYRRALDKEDVLVQRIMKAYGIYANRAEDAALAILMSEIDEFCRERNWETPQEVGIKPWDRSSAVRAGDS